MNTIEPVPSDPSSPFDLGGLIDRLKLLITTPSTCWDVIASETLPPKAITTRYVVPLVVVGAICSFIGLQVFGITIPFLGTWRPPLISSLFQHIVFGIFQIGGLFLSALVISKIAPSFGGSSSYDKAFSLAAYSMLPSLAARVLEIIPALKAVGLLVGLLGLYLFYTGTPKMLGVPNEKRIGFLVVSVLVMIVVMFVVGSVAFMFGATPPVSIPT